MILKALPYRFVLWVAQKVHCGSAGLLISVKQRQRAQKQGADALWLPPLGGKQFKFRQIFRNLLNYDLQGDPSLYCKVAYLRIGPPGGCAAVVPPRAPSFRKPLRGR